MKTLNCTLVIIGLIILTITNPLIARFDYWDSENGVKIRQGHHVFWTGTAMITDDNDHWLIAWADARNGTMDVYAQLYDADGNELWTPGGILVANGEYPEEMPILAYAGNGDWIIGWQDYRLDVNYRGEMMLYVQKYNSNGEALWQEGGVFVGPEGGNQIEAKNQTAPLMFSTSDGGVICVYQNSVDRRVQYFGQRLSNDGKMIWDNQGVLLTENANNIKICPDENDGVFISINRYGRDDESDIFINHLDSNGELCWGENTDGISLPL